jgi:DnaJ-class molecular chaperone
MTGIVDPLRSRPVSTDADEPQTDAAPARACSPCRATGTVISNLGGTPSTEPCPWCGGSGEFDPERDAQAVATAARAGATGAGSV